MIHRLYNPWQITNDGEREADRHLVLPVERAGEIVYVLHSLRISSRYHRVQMSGECDFVIFTTKGIMVVEVKGGIIGHGDSDHGKNAFYRLSEDDHREPVKNPFKQADENAHAIMDFLRDSGYHSVFVGSFVCFPECVFDYRGVDFQDIWHRGNETRLFRSDGKPLTGSKCSISQKS
jgi:hypothetical protein